MWTCRSYYRRHPIYFRFLLAVSCAVFIINLLSNANGKYAVSLKCSFCVQHWIDIFVRLDLRGWAPPATHYHFNHCRQCWLVYSKTKNLHQFHDHHVVFVFLFGTAAWMNGGKYLKLAAILAFVPVIRISIKFDACLSLSDWQMKMLSWPNQNIVNESFRVLQEEWLIDWFDWVSGWLVGWLIDRLIDC